MHILTLIAAPERADLSDAALAEVARSWPLGRARWLAVGEAVEASLPSLPAADDRWQLWERWQERGIDLVVLPAPARRKRVLLADMDSTMIEQECIDELAVAAGVGDLVAGITARAMSGELDFAEALRARVALLVGLPLDVVVSVLKERITPSSGGAALVATMKAHGAHAALVSGGFTPFSAPVAQLLGFDEHRANTLVVQEARLTGEVAEPVLGAGAKAAALREITAGLGLSPAEAIAVGDGANDLPMLQLAGIGVALHAKPEVAAQCEVRINHGDLTSLLYLQGYAAQEFVRPSPQSFEVPS